MDPATSWTLLGVAACVVVAALASAADAALTAISRHRVSAMLHDGRPRAETVTRLLDDPGRFKATTLTLNTAAAMVATALTLAAAWPWGAAWWLPILSLAGLLLVFLIVGEALPKAIATARPAQTATFVAPLLNAFAVLLRPVSGLVNLVVRPVVGGSGNMLVSEEELKMLVNVGEEEGVIERNEREMIEDILVFGDTLVREVMVPRVDLVALPMTHSVAQAVNLVLSGVHSRIPVYRDTIDNIVGILYVRDLLPLLRDGQHGRLVGEIVRPVYYVPETMKVADLLRNLQARKVHMAVVVDEYGGTAGLATIEDVLEEIVGDIQDEYDREEPTIEQLDTTTWLVDGRISLDDLNDHTGLHLATEEVDSLGGLVYEQLGSIPQVGDTVEVGDVTITVRSVQGLRPEKLELVQHVAVPAGEHEEPDDDDS